MKAARREVPVASTACRRTHGLGLIMALTLLALAIAKGHVMAQSPGTHGKATIELDRVTRVFLLANQLEYAPSGSDDAIRFEGLGWIGGDYNRLWLRLKGEQPTVGGRGELQADVLYGRLVTPFWTAVAGVRLDTRDWGGERVTRGLLGIGLEGLAPYWLEMEPMLYVSQKGNVSFRFATSVDLLFTQRLILQPNIEVNAAIQDVPEFGVASGINDIELGARARYEFRREFAPYIGISWVRRAGGTAGLARAAGESVGETRFVAGVRLWR